MNENQVIAQALSILEARIAEPGAAINSPNDVKNYVALQLAERNAEVFAVLFLSTRNTVIAFEELFQGTIDGASVYPREVIRAIFKHNAAAVILVHNHPSGLPSPSEADKRLTEKFSQILAVVEVRVLDHLIVGGVSTYSFSEHGLL